MNINGTPNSETIYGTPEADVILGDAGNDLIIGDTGDDALYGEADSDTLEGEDGADSLIGGEGNDTLEGGEGSDVLYGGEGYDTASYRHALSGVTANLGIILTYQDTVGAGSDYFYSIEGLMGSAFNDILLGDGSSNIFNGRAGSDYIDGGEGIDIADYTDSESAVDVNLQTGVVICNSGNDSIVNIENIRGTSFADTIRGNASDNTIYGNGGVDTFFLSGVYSQYSITDLIMTGNSSFLCTISGVDGIDTLYSFEKILFSDGYFQNGVFTSTANVNPSLRKDSAIVNEDSSVIINVLGNDTDANGDELTVTAVNGLKNGTAVINGDNTITYTPNANYNGTESFTYTVSDGQGGMATQRVNVTINSMPDDIEPNFVPALGKDNVTMDEDTSVTINVLANDRDADGGTLTVVSFSNVRNGTAVINSDNTITYTPIANFNGTESFLYTVSDGQGGTATQRVNVTINPVFDEVEPNFAPTLKKDSATVNEDGSVIINVLANDTDNDGHALTVISIGKMINGTAVINGDNTITFTPNKDYNGQESFVYTVSDGHGGESAQRVNVTVVSVPDADIEGTLGNDVSIIGTLNSESIAGLAGNDTIYGDNGDDRIIGGYGDDILFGNAGMDTFVFEVGGGIDTIKDFSVAQGDWLNFDALIVGYDPVTDSINDFLSTTVSGADTIVSFDRDGTDETYAPQQVAVLENTILPPSTETIA